MLPQYCSLFSLFSQVTPPWMTWQILFFFNNQILLVLCWCHNFSLATITLLRATPCAFLSPLRTSSRWLMVCFLLLTLKMILFSIRFGFARTTWWFCGFWTRSRRRFFRWSCITTPRWRWSKGLLPIAQWPSSLSDQAWTHDSGSRWFLGGTVLLEAESALGKEEWTLPYSDLFLRRFEAFSWSPLYQACSTVSHGTE